MPRLLAAVLIVLATPLLASAQASPEVATTSVDHALIGHWQLLEVEDVGALGRYGATVEALTGVFGADGEASVAMTVAQDGERYDRTRDFRFATRDGAIVGEDDRAMCTYEPISPDEVRLTLTDGLVVRMRRVAG